MKVIITIMLLLSSAAIAEEFNWSTYEVLCWQNGKEPSYEEYQQLTENGQCYAEEEEELCNLVSLQD